MIEAVLFDVGGTLHRRRASAELSPSILRSVETGPWSDDEIAEAYTRTHKDVRARYAASKTRCSRSELPRIAREHVAAWLEALGVQPTRTEAVMAAWEAREPIDRYMPGAREALRALHGRGLALGIVSNTFRDHRESLARDGLVELFRTVVLSIEVGVWKPDREIFAIAVRELGIPPERVVHVGDNEEKDIVAARAAGLHAIHIGEAGFAGVMADPLLRA